MTGSTNTDVPRRAIFWSLAFMLFVLGAFIHFVTRGQELIVLFPEIKRTLPTALGELVSSIKPMPALLEFSVRALLLAFAMLFAEAAIIGWTGSSLRSLVRRENRVKRDFVFTLFSSVSISPMFAAASTLGLSYLLAEFVEFIGPVFVVRGSLGIALQFFLVMLGQSFISYWRHRLMHAVPVLWQFHKAHHSATEMNVLNEYRDVPMALWMAAVTAIPLQFLGTVDVSEHTFRICIVVALYQLVASVRDANAHLIHSKVGSTYGWTGRYLFASPAYHRIHHSLLTEHANKNFSADIVVWDWLFRTRVDPCRVANCNELPIGIEDNAYDKGSVLYDYFFRAIWDALRIGTGGRCDTLTRYVRSSLTKYGQMPQRRFRYLGLPVFIEQLAGGPQHGVPKSEKSNA